jgi:hypothetical protein
MVTTGTYYPAAPGARTWRDAKPLMIGRKRVSAGVYPGSQCAVFIGGIIAYEGPIPADVTTPGAFQIWAAETAKSYSR